MKLRQYMNNNYVIVAFFPYLVYDRKVWFLSVYEFSLR